MSGRVLVTGSNGFVGMHLCRHLAARGYEVFGCDLVSAEDSPRRRICDIADAQSIEEAVQWAGPLDFVVHLAAITFVPDATNSPAEVVDVNFLGTIRLTEALQAQAPESRLVFVGSSEVYGPRKETPITEERSLAPANPYAISKAAADEYCRFLSQNSGMDIVRMRPFNHSGPGQSDRFVLSSFARQIAEIEKGQRKAVIEVGNLEAARDFMHVNDVVRAYETALQKGRAGEAYNICSGQSHRIGDALEALVAMSDAVIRIEVDPKRFRPADIAEIRGSHDKFTRDTAWKPEETFEGLLADLLAYWRETA
ncbi:MAG: SDR family NAD(P)-dependent oxidoreductase [Candidatus Hydrogenedentes bacterium]|nr:SDR family NAD(P)-dependent oxidoreductase [Candidatus Hydrogenedentota bacterium]